MRNKDYQTMASFPGFSPTMASGLAAACCSSNKNAVALRTINAQVVDEFGDILSGVHVWVEGQKEQGTETDINGNFSLKNVPDTAVVTFSHVSIETNITALSIADKVIINTVMEGPEVIISAKKDNTLKYVGYGLLALLVLYGVSRMGKNTVKASI